MRSRLRHTFYYTSFYHSIITKHPYFHYIWISFHTLFIFTSFFFKVLWIPPICDISWSFSSSWPVLSSFVHLFCSLILILSMWIRHMEQRAKHEMEFQQRAKPEMELKATMKFKRSVDNWARMLPVYLSTRCCKSEQ